MSFITLAFAIYLAIIAASGTILVVATSGWYVKRCKKMVEKMMETEFDED